MFIVFIILIIIGSTQKFSPYSNKILDSYGKQIRVGILVIAFLSIGLVFFPNILPAKDTGGVAIELLWIILFIPILAKVFNQSLAKKLIPWRKEIGILMGMMALVHGIQYIAIGGIITNITSTSYWMMKFNIPFFVTGFIALIFSTLLLITSNLYSQIKLKKYWKHLHRLVYPMLVLVIIHVIMIKYMSTSQIAWEEVIPLVIYFGLKIAEWKKVSLFLQK